MDADGLIECLESAAAQKEHGNQALSENDAKTALARYYDALKLVEGRPKLAPSGCSEQYRLLWDQCSRQAVELELACQLNIAHCCIKLQMWTEAVDAAGAALQRDPRSVKAHYRRGVARAGGGYLQEARIDLLAAAKLSPQDKAIRRELVAVKRQILSLIHI